MARRWKSTRRWPKVLLVVGLIWLAQECRFYIPKWIRPPKNAVPVVVELKTTSYCHCRRCCSYKWLLFLPYQKIGLFNYRFKHVGITSSGTMARPGTIAADTSIYPYGTIMYIPGYGYGRVEDSGGAVKGRHIDLYRPNHWFARHWGVQSKRVKIWRPSQTAPEASAEVIPRAEGVIEP
jgi:3D (Asp-Asp-Asp) domain-containing protein